MSGIAAQEVYWTDRNLDDWTDRDSAGWFAIHCPQRNSPERARMLAERAVEQRSRVPGFTPMLRKPRGFTGKWNPAQPKQFAGAS